MRSKPRYGWSLAEQNITPQDVLASIFDLRQRTLEYCIKASPYLCPFVFVALIAMDVQQGHSCLRGDASDPSVFSASKKRVP